MSLLVIQEFTQTRNAKVFWRNKYDKKRVAHICEQPVLIKTSLYKNSWDFRTLPNSVFVAVQALK